MNYREEVLRTMVVNSGQELTMGAMGLAGESGEVVDLIKKHIFHGKPLDRENLLLELGDVRWYIEVLLAAVGYTMEEVEVANIKKLRARHPNGFNTAAYYAPANNASAADAAARKDEWKK